MYIICFVENKTIFNFVYILLGQEFNVFGDICGNTSFTLLGRCIVRYACTLIQRFENYFKVHMDCWTGRLTTNSRYFVTLVKTWSWRDLVHNRSKVLDCSDDVKKQAYRRLYRGAFVGQWRRHSHNDLSLNSNPQIHSSLIL